MKDKIEVKINVQVICDRCCQLRSIWNALITMGIEAVFPNLPFMNIAGQLQKLYSAIKDSNSAAVTGLKYQRIRSFKVQIELFG
jgi:hypothetical protein